MSATTVEYKVRIHHEDDAYWADVLDLPGCFASGDTLDELAEALGEAIVLYLQDEGSGSAPAIEVSEMTVATSAIPQPA